MLCCKKSDMSSLPRIEAGNENENSTTQHVLQNRFNYDRYATIKSAGIGLLDVALMVDSAARIRYIVNVGDENKWYLPTLIMVAISLGFQVLVALLLIYLGTQDIQTNRKRNCLKRINVAVTILTGLITIVNIISQQILVDAGVFPLFRNNMLNNNPTVPTNEGSGM